MAPSKNPTIELVHAVAVATAECTALMNEQFLALIRRNSTISHFEAKMSAANWKRELSMNNLLNYVQVFGW